MNIQMNTAAGSMRELQKQIDTIANNISNVNTNGYKRQEANFSDALVQSYERQAGAQNEAGRQTPLGIRIGAGATVSQIALRTEQGAAAQTGQPLDMMIQGKTGFFRIASEGNTHYTKDGSFGLEPAADGTVSLVTAGGDAVLGADNAPIVFGSDYDAITVSRAGTLEVTYKTAGQLPDSFQLSIAEIVRPDLLERTGGNLYRLPGTEAEQTANGTLRVVDLAEGGDEDFVISQGMLEGSNVDLAKEMTELITAQRMIQSHSRAIQFADDMRGLVNTIRG